MIINSNTKDMANFYSKNAKPGKSHNVEKRPRKETIKFLLDYSKALKVSTYEKIKFEAVLN